MSTQIKAQFTGLDTCPRCKTPVGDTGVIIAPWSWSEQVEAYRLLIAGKRQLKDERGEIDSSKVPIEEAARAAIEAHGGFFHRCAGVLEDGSICGTSFFVTVSDPDLISVES